MSDIPSRIILASGSPRRKELLEQAWLLIEVFPADINEDVHVGEAPSAYAKRLAKEKAAAVSKNYPEDFIIAADTIVVSPKGDILGKPKDEEDARKILGELQGKVHEVSTAYSIQCLERGVENTKIITTQVEMSPLSSDEIESYVLTDEPHDKAGAYAIQGAGASFIKSIKGSYTNVVGLPLAEVCTDLVELGAIETRL